jgi:hypothetical protein
VALIVVTSVNAKAQDPVVDFRSEKSWPALAQDRRVVIAESDSELSRVLKKRHNACLFELRNRFTYWLQGTGTLESVCDNLDRFIESHRELGVSPEDELQLQNDRLAFAQAVQKHADFVITIQNETVKHIDSHFAHYYVLHAEVSLLQMTKSKEKTGIK